MMRILDDIKMIHNWKKTKDFLLNAKSFVSENPLNEVQIQVLKDFDEFLEYNELGLAYDQLFFYLTQLIYQLNFGEQCF